MLVYFTLQTIEGDTILDFSTGDPYAVMCGVGAILLVVVLAMLYKKQEAVAA